MDQKKNLADPRDVDILYRHRRDEGGDVTTRWNGNDTDRPPEVEIGQAKQIAKATGEPVVLYGNAFGGVDGTIGRPPRLLQLKAAHDAPTLVRVIRTAKENAQQFGDRGLEVHVLAPQLTLEKAQQALRAEPTTFGVWLGAVTVYVEGGGWFKLPESGRP
jgi:hypothetical protein